MSIPRFSRLVSVVVLIALLTVPATVTYAQGDGHGDEDETDHTPHWGYDGMEGPDYWGELSADFETCGTGTLQSPVDLSGVEATGEGALDIHWETSDLYILNNGHTIQLNYHEGSAIELDGKVFNLIQFHFHQGSENTINGMQAAMEVHFVHASEEGELAVIGVMLEEGEADNAAYQTFWAHLPTLATETRTIPAIEIDANELLPENKSYYRFMGSLTTPPCTEGVNWVVMTEPVYLSTAQLETFGAIYDHNFRPVQPINDRAISINQSK